jgi:diguanylate cyclase (GGDEF)-like protein
LASNGATSLDEHVIETPGNGQRVISARRLLLDENGEPQFVLGVVEDITELRKTEAQIIHMTRHDLLTDLPNHAAFTEHLAAKLDRAARGNKSFAILSIDLDRFKEVNDVFGHAVGDALLREVSRRLQQISEGAYLARFGGDEFIFITTYGLQPSTAEALAVQARAAMEEDIEIDDHRIRINLSIGVAIFPMDGTDTTSLIGNANAALFRAKAEGRGTVRFFERDMDKCLRERRALQHDLRSAIDHDELALHYQPQASIDGRIVGFEALLRWHHPRRGLVSPSTFIPAAEESGLIIAIGEWVLREACREAASWPWPLQIAVNLSPGQFRHDDLVGLVHAILLETGLDARRLELEITEGVLIGDFSRALSILRRLKSLGVRISMDDFGTGYSSLSNLQSFPFDKIKIDQTFVSNLEKNGQSRAIVRGVLSLARGLNLPVLAEGVETRAQLAFLAQEGCHEVQGYLIGFPSPIADYAELIGRPRSGRLTAVGTARL